MVFSFRSPDYSAPLSSQHQTEPHVRIKAMSDPQVGEFLTHCSPDGPRVLRVGSWRSYGLRCRCACRFKARPGYRIAVFGFQVCCAPPIR
jgi:hypothetical protein